MVGVVGDDHALVLADDPRDADGEVDGLGAGAHEVTDPQRFRHRRGEPLRVADDVVVQVARVRVQRRRLARQRGDHVRMAMPDRGHVVVAVEVAPAVRVEEPGALAAHEVHGTVVEQPVARPERAAAPLAQCVDIDVRRRAADAPAGGAVALVHFRAIERQEPRQRAHDVGPLFREPGRRLFGRVDAEVVHAERGREPEQRQVVQDLQLLVLERQHGIPRLHLRDGVLERHLAVAGEAREGHREVLHERRVHHVAEIDDADDLVAAGLGAQQVFGVAVAVHDLGAQGRQPRQDLALEARVEVRAERLGVVGHPGLDAGLQEQRPLDVPGHEVARVRVEEPPQSVRELRLESGGMAKGVDPERLALRKRASPESSSAAAPCGACRPRPRSTRGRCLSSTR